MEKHWEKGIADIKMNSRNNGTVLKTRLPSLWDTEETLTSVNSVFWGSFGKVFPNGAKLEKDLKPF